MASLTLLLRRPVFRSPLAVLSTTSALFSSAASPSLPRNRKPPAGPLSEEEEAKRRKATADNLLEVMNEVTVAAADAPPVLGHLHPNTVISPGHLSPNYLLTPYLPRPDYTLAYPLGPPVSAAAQHDVFVRLGMNPLDSPMNPWLRAEFCTAMGKIKGRGKTGLQRGNQRKMGKAVRRARSMGIVAVFGQSLPSSGR